MGRSSGKVRVIVGLIALTISAIAIGLTWISLRNGAPTTRIAAASPIAPFGVPSSRAFEGRVAVEDLTPRRVADEVHRRLDAPMTAAGYEPERIKALADRLGEFVSVQGSGTWEDYKSLLRKWGGTLKYEAADPQLQRAAEDDRRRCWAARDHPSAMTEYFFGTTEVVTYDREKPGGSLTPEIMPLGVTANEGFCAARFPNDPAKIRRGKADVVRVHCLTRDRSGQEVGWYWFFVWSGSDGAWLPAHVVTMVPQGYPATWPHF